MFRLLNFSTSVSLRILRNQVMRESDVPFFSVSASASIQNPNSIITRMHSEPARADHMTDDGWFDV